MLFFVQWTIVLVSLLLTLNRFHTLFWCFHCWLWACKDWLKKTFFEIFVVLFSFHISVFISSFLSGNLQKQPLEVFCKKGVLKTFVNFTGKHLRWNLFFIKLQTFSPTTLLKETPTQVLSCEICESFNNNYFEEHLRTTASVFRVQSNI